MDAPLSMPSEAPSISLVWRAISSLYLVRRLLGISDEGQALATAARAPASPVLRSFDFEGADTSLTQAELEVLK
jgi:hypothetical protein